MALKSKKITSYIVMIFGLLSFFITLMASYVTDLIINFQMPIMLKAVLITVMVFSASIFIVSSGIYSWYRDKQSSLK